MDGILIALGAIILANCYPFVVNILRIEKGLLQFTLLYIVSIFIAMGTAAFASGITSKGENGVLLLLGIGVIVRVGVHYFRKTQPANQA